MLFRSLDREAGEIRAAYSAWDERDGEAKIQEAARVWRPAVEGIIDANLDADLRDAARSLAVPTLVICGDPAAGGAVTLADGDAVASANPNVRLVRIAGAGHSPHRDDPEAVCQALADWLPARLPGRRAYRDRRMERRSHRAGVSTSRPASGALLSRIA